MTMAIGDGDGANPIVDGAMRAWVFYVRARREGDDANGANARCLCARA
jgi:hypothetical protein